MFAATSVFAIVLSLSSVDAFAPAIQSASSLSSLKTSPSSLKMGLLDDLFAKVTGGGGGATPESADVTETVYFDVTYAHGVDHVHHREYKLGKLWAGPADVCAKRGNLFWGLNDHFWSLAHHDTFLTSLEP
ncbi:hypothetical protein FRACYDRAFT_253538 [Fragilariopsis cylindrus CCMP1102]|uniref:Uncharacterized protein n=1 Tax=Fragilariopsis cylindrus CCMP1102 TaxID=635003 RepID=A0A1E7ELN5_9STRA|nr:hypothetical protein FRACYDRAFT_253538 [Fragilariopsis cylindrus CCMP1102]|eukprot:OEU06756.1 hypothetical protein FRACYDRAFT_253538 [Fragilariopsis cylindrus CCMP1102]